MRVAVQSLVMKHSWCWSFCALAVFFVAAACHQPQNRQVVKTEVRPPQVATIEDVRIAGNNRITTETIQAKIATKPGEPFNRVVINKDEDRLRSLGYFDDVRVTVEIGPNGGRIVTFNVREKRP
jgi:outer membrane protein assembly factor BamA